MPFLAGIHESRIILAIGVIGESFVVVWVFFCLVTACRGNQERRADSAPSPPIANHKFMTAQVAI